MLWTGDRYNSRMVFLTSSPFTPMCSPYDVAFTFPPNIVFSSSMSSDHQRFVPVMISARFGSIDEPKWKRVFSLEDYLECSKTS